MKKFAALCLCAFALANIAPASMAQAAYPTRNIQIIIGYPPGGGTDVISRVLAHEAGKILGRELIVLNKPGGSGTIAVTAVASAPPDGYTLGITPNSSTTTSHFAQNVPADLLERTTPLLGVGRLKGGLLARADSPLRNLKDMIDFARQNPGKVSIGVPGVGSKPALVFRALAAEQKVEFTITPFAGEAPALVALLGGHVTTVAQSSSTWEQQHAAGQLRLLASTDEERLQSDLSVPTLIEQGFPQSASSIFYLFGPKGLPPAVAKRIIDVFTEATHTQAYRDVVARNGIDLKNPLAGEALERYLLEDRARTGRMVEKLGIKKE